MQQKVILIGLGKVGKTFLKQVLSYDGISAEMHNNPTVVVGVALKDSLIFSPYGLKDEEIEGIISGDFSCGERISINSTQEILGIATRHGLNGEIIFVDATAGKDDMKDFHLEVIEKSDNYIVTANKNPVSLYDYDVFKRLTKNKRYQYTTTVMAGTGIVRFMRGTLKISDTIHTVTGVFSGTLGYITGELDKGRKISQVIREAYDLGYTEPNIWDDLNGLDVARKLIILARSAGYKVNIENVEIKSFLPESFGKIKSLDEFLEFTKSEDENFATKVEKAKNLGKCMRYVASFENNNGILKMEVGLKLVDKNSSIGRLDGPANLVEMISSIFTNNSPYILQSPGAGLEITSGGLRKDMLSFLPALENINEEFMK